MQLSGRSDFLRPSGMGLVVQTGDATQAKALPPLPDGGGPDLELPGDLSVGKPSVAGQHHSGALAKALWVAAAAPFPEFLSLRGAHLQGTGARTGGHPETVRGITVGGRLSPITRMNDRVPALLTAAELAAKLRVSESFVYHAAADGRLPVLRVGSRLRFDLAAVLSSFQNDSK